MLVISNKHLRFKITLNACHDTTLYIIPEICNQFSSFGVTLITPLINAQSNARGKIGDFNVGAERNLQMQQKIPQTIPQKTFRHEWQTNKQTVIVVFTARCPVTDVTD